MTPRVVVTGIGVIAPNGSGVADFEEAIRKGESGIRHVEEMAASKFACTVAGVPRGVDALVEANTALSSAPCAGRGRTGNTESW